MPREQLVSVTLIEPGHVQPSWQGPQQMSQQCMLRELHLLMELHLGVQQLAVVLNTPASPQKTISQGSRLRH